MSTFDFSLTNNAFDLISLTEAANQLDKPMSGPDQYFSDEPVMHPTFAVEIKDGTMKLLDSVPNKGKPVDLDDVDRKVYPFTTAHFPITFSVTAEDVANKRKFGTENMAQMVDDAMAEKLEWGRNTLLNQQAYMKWGALKGIVLDGDGSSTLYSWFTEFGVTEESITFALTTASTNVVQHCASVVQHMMDNAKGENFTDIHGYCGATFWHQLISHAKVAPWYQNSAMAQGMQSGFLNAGFRFGDILFFRAFANTTASDGSTAVKMVDDTDCRFVPVGTKNVFRNVLSPAQKFMETINTPGREFYAKSQLMDYNAGYDVWMESNVMPICKNPALCVKGVNA